MTKLSIDDVLEEERSKKVNNADGLEPYPEDFDPPAQPAGDLKTYTSPHDHPSHDSDMDAQELYESEGDEY